MRPGQSLELSLKATQKWNVLEDAACWLFLLPGILSSPPSWFPQQGNMQPDLINQGREEDRGGASSELCPVETPALV